MSRKLSKWGNSLAYRIPKAYAEQLHWDKGTEVDAIVVSGKLVIKAVGLPYTSVDDIPVYKLEELLDSVTPELTHGEISAGHAVGNEL